jgi:hypothetical protein
MRKVLNEASELEGLGLAEAVVRLREDLLEAWQAGADAEIQFPVDSLTVELKVVATKGVDGKAGFKIPIIQTELGGSANWKKEATQTVTVRFSAPVDHNGNPIKVASANNEEES